MTPNAARRPPVFRGLGEMLFVLKFGSIQNFVTEVEMFIDSKVKELEREYDENAKQLSEEERQEAGEYYGDVIYEYEQYTGILRRSLFIYIYSVAENMLDDFCGSLKSKKNLKVSLGDFGGKGIERAKNYLNKVAEIEFPGESDEWREIKVYNLIRNRLVHREGKLENKENSKDDQRIREWALKHPDCIEVKKDVVEQEFLELKRDLCYRAMKVIGQFFRQLYKENNE